MVLAFIHQPYPEVKSFSIHFDVKSPNILLDDHYKAKLGDFGLIKHLNSQQPGQSQELAGTIGQFARILFPFLLPLLLHSNSPTSLSLLNGPTTTQGACALSF